MERPLLLDSAQATTDELDAKLTISIFASFVSLTLAILYWYFRLGLHENLIAPIFGTLFLGFFLFSLVPCVLLYESHFKVKLFKTQNYSDGLILLAGLSALLMFGMVPSIVSSIFYILTGLLGFIGVSVVFVSWMKTGSLLKNIGLLLLAIFFGLWVAKGAWGTHYQSPIYEEHMAEGVAHVDTLYHAAISNMIKDKWMPSLGLNGNPYIGYHYGSHWVFAQLSKLSGIRILQFYQLCVPIIFDSLQILILLFLSFDLRRLFWKEQNYKSIRSDYVFWCYFLIFELGFIPAQRFTYPLFTQNHLMSESYNLAITISLIYVSLLLPTLTKFTKFKKNPNKTTLFFLIPSGIALLSFIKISIGFIFMAIIGIFFLRFRLYQKLIFTLSMALCTVTYVAIFLLTLQLVAGGVRDHFMPFGYLTSFFGGYKMPIYLFIFFSSPILYFLLRCWSLKIKNIIELKKICISQNALDVEFVFLIFIFAGVLPMVFMANSEAHYFTDYNRWITLPLCLGMLGSEHFKKFYDKKRKLIIPVLVIFWMVIFNNWMLSLRALSLVKDPLVSQRNLDQLPQYHLIQNLQQLDLMSISEKRENLLYIPKTNRIYWDMLKNCRAVPLIAPAVAGLAVLEGFPEKGCYLHYGGMEKYPELNTAVVSKLTPREACEKTLSLHFSKLIYLDYDSKNGISQRNFACKDFSVN